jgi:hypothetical protein
MSMVSGLREPTEIVEIDSSCSDAVEADRVGADGD